MVNSRSEQQARWWDFLTLPLATETAKLYIKQVQLLGGTWPVAMWPSGFDAWLWMQLGGGSTMDSKLASQPVSYGCVSSMRQIWPGLSHQPGLNWIAGKIPGSKVSGWIYINHTTMVYKSVILTIPQWCKKSVWLASSTNMPKGVEIGSLLTSACVESHKNSYFNRFFTH